jgi:hypothetical protein
LGWVLVSPPEVVGAELEAAGPEDATALLAEPPVAEVERANSAAAVTSRVGVVAQGLVYAAPRTIRLLELSVRRHRRMERAEVALPLERTTIIDSTRRASRCPPVDFLRTDGMQTY